MKKIIKSRVFWCLITVLVVGTVSVVAATYFPSNQVTYDNTASGLSSTNVQGAIDELYAKCDGSIGGGNVVSIATTNSTQFVLTSDGTVYAWNQDYKKFNQLGNIGEPCVSIAAASTSNSYSLYVLSSDGTVYVWNHDYRKFNQRGNLGVPAVSIAVLYDTPYLVTSDGTVYVWNWNTNRFSIRGNI